MSYNVTCIDSLRWSLMGPERRLEGIRAGHVGTYLPFAAPPPAPNPNYSPEGHSQVLGGGTAGSCSAGADGGGSAVGPRWSGDARRQSLESYM